MAVRADPAFWEWDIRRFERQDRRRMPPAGGILFTGSSSIRYWETLEKDLAPLTVLNRGFGGSKIHEVTHFVDRIVFPYYPEAVVLYAGENDITGFHCSKKKTAEEVLSAFKMFCEVIHREIPKSIIYFVSIKPPVKRHKFWAEMKRANQLIESYTRDQPGIKYVDVATAMLDPEGKPRLELYQRDGVHMQPEGYRIWTAVIKRALKPDLLTNHHTLHPS